MEKGCLDIYGILNLNNTNTYGKCILWGVQLKTKCVGVRISIFSNLRIKYFFIKSPIPFAVLKAQKINESVPFPRCLPLKSKACPISVFFALA